jgi:hypothetical protein
MSRILDFKTKYEPKIFAIDPAIAGVLGWAILNLQPEIFGDVKNKPMIHKSGVLKPFSSESSQRNMKELICNLKTIWHADSGYSSQPSVLVIEQPHIYPGSPVNPRCMLDLASFAGEIAASFSSRLLLRPITNEWKKNKSKDITKKELLDICDKTSLKNIKRDMDGIALDKQHNAFDAMGLGLYGLKVINNQIAKPRLNF